VSVRTSWTHIGRLWTNGEPHLAVDAGLRGGWLGSTDDDYFEQIVSLGPDRTSIAIGDGTAALVGADGVVRDDSWMEVFESTDCTLAIVQAAGSDYRRTLSAALRYPTTADDAGTVICIPSGELAIFSAALDGTGEHAMNLLAPQPGPVPAQHGPPSREPGTGLRLPARSDRYELKVRWYTELDDSSCFARWLLMPQLATMADPKQPTRGT
jgi:hypothetical protein